MSTLQHHLYVPIEVLSSTEHPSSLRNIKTIGFVRDDYLCGCDFDSTGKATVGEHKVKVNFDYIGSNSFLHYCPYVVYAVIDWVDSAPLLTPKHVKELKTDVLKYHKACLEISRLFPPTVEAVINNK